MTISVKINFRKWNLKINYCCQPNCITRVSINYTHASKTLHKTINKTTPYKSIFFFRRVLVWPNFLHDKLAVLCGKKREKIDSSDNKNVIWTILFPRVSRSTIIITVHKHSIGVIKIYNTWSFYGRYKIKTVNKNRWDVFEWIFRIYYRQKANLYKV